MTDSEFWRDLGARFRALPQQRWAIEATWSRDSPGANRTWKVSGPHPDITQQVIALAVRGGQRLLQSERPPDEAWLEEALNRNLATGVATYRRVAGTPKDHFDEYQSSGMIHRLADQSAHLCSLLETDALREEGMGAPPKPHTSETQNDRSIGSPLPAKTPQHEKQRQEGTVTSRLAADRTRQYMQDRSMTQAAFAKRCGTTDRTLRSFFKTAKIRKGLLIGIATAMKTTVESLLNVEHTGK